MDMGFPAAFAIHLGKYIAVLGKLIPAAGAAPGVYTAAVGPAVRAAVDMHHIELSSRITRRMHPNTGGQMFAAERAVGTALGALRSLRVLQALRLLPIR